MFPNSTTFSDDHTNSNLVVTLEYCIFYQSKTKTSSDVHKGKYAFKHSSKQHQKNIIPLSQTDTPSYVHSHSYVHRHPYVQINHQFKKQPLLNKHTFIQANTRS